MTLCVIYYHNETEVNTAAQEDHLEERCVKWSCERYGYGYIQVLMGWKSKELLQVMKTVESSEFLEKISQEF